MIHGIECALDIPQDLLPITITIVGRDILRPGVELRADGDVRHGLVLEDAPQALEARDDGFDVRGVGQPGGVDERLGVGEGRGDGDVAAGLGRDVDGHEGCVLVAVGEAAGSWVLEVADVAGEREVLELGPVGWEGSEVWNERVKESGLFITIGACGVMVNIFDH